MSFQKGKTDAELGYKVEEYLKSKGVHTPTLIDPLLKKEEWKIKKIEKYFTAIMETLGLDLQDDSLIDTPKRVAKMYVNEILKQIPNKRQEKVTSIVRQSDFVEINGEKFDYAIIATHADEALRILKDATSDERADLSAINYSSNRIQLHSDESVMPKANGAKASWNYLMNSCTDNKSSVVVS